MVVVGVYFYLMKAFGPTQTAFFQTNNCLLLATAITFYLCFLCANR